METEYFIAIVMGISVFGLLCAVYLAKWVLKHDTGSAEMQKISDAIKEGAEAFLRRQNKTIALMAVVLAALLFCYYAFVRGSKDFDPVDEGWKMASWITLSFVFGAICSVIAGYVGMWVSIRSNIRAASAARTSLNDALRVAMRGGAVSGLLVTCMSLLGVVGLFGLVSAVTDVDDTEIPLLIIGYGFGASFVALFAQLGGGIYTKAADVGADLVGKVEAGIPEDDPRNPAVIADLVGDNVGDCAGRGADLFESTAAENIGAMILAAGLAIVAQDKGFEFREGIMGVLMFPLVARAFGIIASVIGIMSVKMDKEEKMDPMQVLNKGYYVAVVLAMIAFGAASYWLLDAKALVGVDPITGKNVYESTNAWWHFYLCGIIGVVTSVAFVYVTQYYTEYKYRPVQSIANASVTGPATNIIAGIGVGFECVALPVCFMGAALLGSYQLGNTCGLPHAGLFGTAVATMGMLSTAAYILAMDTFGPITDNAGGIIEMSQQPEEIRVKTDRLDAVGNTTKALTKGYAIGSAGLAAFLLFQAYMDEVRNFADVPLTTAFPIDLAKPQVFVGALVGAMLVFLFTSFAIRAVGQTAQSIIAEVRRQYATLPRVNDIIQFPKDFKPDYGTCVDIVTKAALRKMIVPGLLAVCVPVGLGVIFRYIYVDDDTPLIAAEAVAGLIMTGTIVGIITALFLNNAGGAWDNSKKYIETGAHGGKYLTDASGKKSKNPTHGAAVVGDTVGDPFKDTAGPSLHVLVKLLSTVTLVLCPLFLQ